MGRWGFGKIRTRAPLSPKKTLKKTRVDSCSERISSCNVSSMKLGTTIKKRGIDFSIHSATDRLWLMLFDEPNADLPTREIEMTRTQEPEGNLSASVFHTYVPDLKPGALYLYRTNVTNSENSGWILDPCAKAVHTLNRWGERNGLTAGTFPRVGKMFPKGVVISDDFDWGNDVRPNTPLENSIIYEAHLRGFTAGGSYLDFIEKIPHLKELGITAVEFLPLFEFNELEYVLRGDSRQKLLNFWGYSTRSFYAPMTGYAHSAAPGAAVVEFKTMVKALHAAGIEIILDVVFNHTAEGEKQDGTYNFQALDEKAYYIQSPDGDYHNWSGCGNTFNANNPVAKQFIIEALKYWATEMHIDGFRFDLATALCRDENGNLLENPPVIRAIEAEPELKDIKLIAEAWDCGGYQVGHFPAKRFSDWNGKFRDDVRRFWNAGQPIGDLATRLAGSSDLYERKDSSPLKSINFITAHDGFTLADLVAYEHKHNEANGEENRDGENQNNNINFGIEGPTQDPTIQANRLRQQKNLLATLLLSQGVPMLLAGDEFGRTQQGNNNAYCQDNEISWINWTQIETNRELFDFTKQLIALRKKHPVLRRKNFFTGQNDLQWIGPNGDEIDWHNSRAIGMHLIGKKPLLILVNNEAQATTFTEISNHWKKELSTAPVNNFTLSPHSLAVFSSPKNQPTDTPKKK